MTGVCLFFWLSSRLTRLSPKVAAAILAAYTGLIGVFQISSSFGKKKPAKEETPKVLKSAALPAGAIPDVDSPEFEKFLENVLENEDQLKALIEKA